MKQADHARAILRQIHLFPLSWLSLSTSKRLLIVLLSYGLGIPGLWFFFPRLNNGASMILPIICLCWLFCYRGLLISILSTGATIWLIYHYILGDTQLDQALIERGVLGLGISLLLGLTICWLRTAVDLMHIARQKALTAEQERLQALEAKHRITLDLERERQVNEIKDQFLLHVNHELRTPLTVLGSSLDVLKEYFAQMDAEERTLLLNQALGSYEGLVRLVNGVLDAATVSEAIPHAHCESVSVLQVVQDALTHLDTKTVQAYTIDLQVPEHVMVWANPQSLYHVLQNLLSNAFKYVPAQTTIRIEARQAHPSSPVCLSVQDEGPGIPPEEIPFLFEKFVRLKRDLVGSTRGMGLGLYICKRMVEAMGGRIWVESSGHTREGSRFCVELLPYETWTVTEG